MVKMSLSVQSDTTHDMGVGAVVRRQVTGQLLEEIGNLLVAAQAVN